MKKLDLTGQTFGEWTVVSALPPQKRCTMWLCRCSCGAEHPTYAAHLTRGSTTRCNNCKRTSGHGDTNARLYGIWHGMKNRATASPRARYAHYVAKGICKEWLAYEPFRDWALSHGYNDTLTIDRVDGKKGYYPDNCRWATYEEQLANRSNTIWVICRGKRMTLSAGCKLLGIAYGTGLKRFQYGHPSLLPAPPIKSVSQR